MTRREEVDMRNAADALVFQTERQMKELEEKINADDKAKLQAAVDRVKNALKGSDANEIRSATDALTQIWSQIAPGLYQQQAQGAPGGEQAPPSGEQPKGDGGVEEAEYVEVDENKKK